MVIKRPGTETIPGLKFPLLIFVIICFLPRQDAGGKAGVFYNKCQYLRLHLVIKVTNDLRSFTWVMSD